LSEWSRVSPEPPVGIKDKVSYNANEEKRALVWLCDSDSSEPSCEHPALIDLILRLYFETQGEEAHLETRVFTGKFDHLRLL